MATGFYIRPIKKIFWVFLYDDTVTSKSAFKKRIIQGFTKNVPYMKIPKHEWPTGVLTSISVNDSNRSELLAYLAKNGGQQIYISNYRGIQIKSIGVDDSLLMKLKLKFDENKDFTVLKRLELPRRVTT